MSYIKRYEKSIINSVKEFAENEGIHFSKMTELLILKAIRQVKEDIEKNKYTEELLQKVKNME